VTDDASTLITWKPTIRLAGGLKLRIAELHGQLTAAQCRTTVLHGSLYAIAGYDDAKHLHAGYAGMSNALKPGRAWRSYTTWTRAISSFTAHRIALWNADPDIDDDTLKIVESRVIRSLSGRGLFMYNTQVSAREATLRLGERAAEAAELGDRLARTIATHAFAGQTNPLNTPAHTLRESAVRAVLSADRALDTTEVLDRLATIGVRYTGQTPDHTIRRDLTQRELDTAGEPRVTSGHRRGRTVYWPSSMAARTALARYDAAHARRSSVDDERRPAWTAPGASAVPDTLGA